MEITSILLDTLDLYCIVQMMVRPHILMLLTDQQRPGTVAALGHPVLKTPALDRLCREGTAFTRCYTPSPVCVPARHALATGLPPHVSGVTDNGQAAPSATSFMQLLANAGYQAHGVGKMHFVPDAYARWGFDSRDTSEEGAHDPQRDDYVRFLHDNGFDHLDDCLGVRGEMYYVPQPAQVPERLHHSRWVADRSIDFLNRRDRSSPFLLCSHFVRPHPPFESPVPWNKLYRADQVEEPLRFDGDAELLTYWNRAQNRYKWRDGVADGGGDRHVDRIIRAAYYAAISHIDFQVGRILEVLGTDIDNTLVLFSSDHGELLGDYGGWGKRCMLDVAAGVPMLARWPGRLPAGHRCDEVTSLLDVFPTISDAASLDVDRPSEEGRSLVDVAAGRADRKVIYSQFQQDGYGLYMAASRTHKYIYSEADQRAWGFDSAEDPQETRPLSDGEPAIAALRVGLIDRFRRDGYVEPLNDARDGWRRYPVRSIPDRPDVGLLYQDKPGLQARINGLGPGYARDVTKPPAESYRLLNPHGV